MAVQEKKPLRTFTLSCPGFDKPMIMHLGRSGPHYVIIPQDPARAEDYGFHQINALLSQDPFPGRSMAGNEMIWVKTYSESVGLLEQLEEQGILRR